MTSPVIRVGSGDLYTVAFVLPSSFTEASAPAPSRPEVTLRTVPARLAAAVQFSGRWTSAAYEKHRQALLDSVAASGLTAIGDPWFARFDPPYVPSFLRHNEVLIEVAPESD